MAFVIHVDVEPESVHRVFVADLFHLSQNVAVIGPASGGAKALPTNGRLGIGRFGMKIEISTDDHFPFVVAHTPFWMSLSVMR